MDDLSAVSAWMSEQGLGGGPVENVSEIAGGTQNVMLSFTRSGREYVFRRGPRHLRPVSNKVILRETRVLHALAGTDVGSIDINRVRFFCAASFSFAGCGGSAVRNGGIRRGRIAAICERAN